MTAGPDPLKRRVQNGGSLNMANRIKALQAKRFHHADWCDCQPCSEARPVVAAMLAEHDARVRSEKRWGLAAYVLGAVVVAVLVVLALAGFEPGYNGGPP